MSSYWNYQVMKHIDTFGEDYYAVHELYHMEDGEGWTENPVEVTGESIEDLKKSLMLMLKDIDKHGVMDYDKVCVSCGNAAAMDFCEFCINEE